MPRVSPSEQLATSARTELIRKLLEVSPAEASSVGQENTCHLLSRMCFMYGIVLALNFYLCTVTCNSFILDLAKLLVPGIKTPGLWGQTNLDLATSPRI